MMMMAAAVLCGSATAETLGDMIREAGWNKIIGTWVDADTKGQNIRVKYAWKYKDHAIQVTSKLGEVQSTGLIGRNAATGEVFMTGVNSEGGATLGKWIEEDGDAVLARLHEQLSAMLVPCQRPLVIDENRKPHVILVVGVNGAGKTTTMGKLALRFSREGRKVMMAAGDTFRAAAVEQLSASGIEVRINHIADTPAPSSQEGVADLIIEVEANDRAGIVKEITNALSEKSVNVKHLETRRENAAMAGYDIFYAIMQAELPSSLSSSALEDSLEALSDDLMVTIKPAD